MGSLIPGPWLSLLAPVSGTRCVYGHRLPSQTALGSSPTCTELLKLACLVKHTQMTPPPPGREPDAAGLGPTTKLHFSQFQGDVTTASPGN